MISCYIRVFVPQYAYGELPLEMDQYRFNMHQSILFFSLYPTPINLSMKKVKSWSGKSSELDIGKGLGWFYLQKFTSKTNFLIIQFFVEPTQMFWANV